MKEWLLQKRWRIIFSGTLIVAAPILGLALFVYIEISGHLNDIINEENKRAALNIATHIENELQGDIRNGGLFTTRLQLQEAIRQRDRKKITRNLKDFVEHISSVERALVADPKGVLLANYSEDLALIGKNFSDRDWYKGVSRNWQPYVSEFYLRAGRPQKYLFAIALPIKDDDNSVIGALVLQAAENYLQDAIGHIPAPKNQKVYVVDKKGNLIYHPDYMIDRIIDFTGFPSVRKVINGQSGVESAKNPDGAAMLTAYQPVKQWGWGVIVQKPEQEVYAALRKLTFGLFAFTAIMIAIGALLAYRRSETLFSLKKLSEELETKVEERTTELSKTNRVLKTLSECNQALVRIEDEDLLIKKLCRIIKEYGGYRLALVGYAEQDEEKTVKVVAQAGYEEDFLEKVRLTWADTEAGIGPLGTAIRSRNISIFKNIAFGEYPAPWREAALKRGYASAIGLPLYSGKDFLGALAIYSSDAFAFDEEEVKLLRELADDMAFGIMTIRSREVHKAAEQSLHASEIRYRRLFEAARDGILILDHETGMIMDVNPFLVKMLGYSREQFLGKPIWGIGFFKDIAANKSNFAELQQKEFIQYENMPLETAHGRLINVEFLSHVYQVGDNKVIQCNIRDITERKQAEDTLRTLSSRHQAILAAVPDIVMETDINKVYLWANQAGYEFFGDDLLGKEASFYFEGEQNTYDKVRPLFNGSENNTIYVESWQRRKDGKKRLLAWWSRVLKDAQGNVTGALSTARDITERRRAEEEQQKAEIAAIAAKAANKAKSDFLANMSHELRTPLNSVIGFSEILHDEMFGTLNEKQKEYINDILISSRHLLSLINDILDLSKVESGKMELELDRFPLKSIIDTSLTMLKEKAMKHRIKLSCDIEPEANIEIEADERKIKQIMFNLLSNAVKFTPDGGSVRVSARKGIRDQGSGIGGENLKPIPQPPAPDRDFIEISVTDTGIGIKPEDMPKLFKEFSQLETTCTKKFEGTGLGLALSKRLIELHGGTIWVESEFGRGSEFRFVLPTAQPDSGLSMNNTDINTKNR